VTAVLPSSLDDLQRLLTATGAYGSISYSYDAADNRLTRNLSGGPSETFTYGTTNNRLVSAAVTGQPLRSFTQDSAGNITLDDRGAGNTVTIAIGADNRPQTITVAGTGATAVAYKHNAFGERVSRVEGAATTHFHYDRDGRLIAESDGTGAVVREYLWLGDKPFGLVVGPAGSATLYFVHADHLERVQKITDGTQAIVWDGQFTPYGRTHAITGTIQNPLRFPGQWADPAAKSCSGHGRTGVRLRLHNSRW
jgi:YD repeat-containing protein